MEKKIGILLESLRNLIKEMRAEPIYSMYFPIILAISFQKASPIRTVHNLEEKVPPRYDLCISLTCTFSQDNN